MILVGGGSRSGKTGFALAAARGRGTRLAYVATAELFDDEMRQRAEAHRKERGGGFVTFEEPREIGALLARRGAEFDAVVVDCVTLWISNLLHAGREDLRAEGAALAGAAQACAAEVILVTNEVGCGIIPENDLARRFRDEAGWMNQTLAERAAEVYWLVFGCALKVKG
ncbi:MAG: bifunctional adenosylcobinamide kinase/adenosylcobinamide-phosphate guanylyltransferase [Bryobacterales bacterium]|nr:bifunctional adenosylcobinamide kinase/adenosylcobinamide-phosphate guanylyltransferase [Bryobacterales bacterium]